jgi:predicted DNA-binding transcriptional regulator YafY
VRASRLVQLLGLLQSRGRMTARQLAAELEVSQRTVLRDIEALSSAGIPVYPTRGQNGGFQLIEGFSSDLPAVRRPTSRPAAPVARATIALSPRGRRLAVLLGRPAGMRIRRGQSARLAGRPEWVKASIAVDSPEATVLDLLALGAEAELLDPPDLRDLVRDTALRVARLHDLPHRWHGDGPRRPSSCRWRGGCSS